MKDRVHSITVLAVGVAFIICIFGRQTAFAEEWDWTEDFSSGMDAWTSQVPGSWQVTDGRLEYATLPAHGQQMCVRYDEYLSLAEGFVIEMTADNSQLDDIQSVGIMFAANYDMSDIWYFDVGATFQYSQVGHLIVGNVNYGYGTRTDSPATSPFVMRLEYDGTILSSFIDGSPWTSWNVHELASSYGDTPIQDGYVGVWLWAQHYPTWVDDFKFRSIPGPTEPPVADADGPYSIYVGDTLTLDASDSTDADNDIVSYMWDLDDDESFETDAGGQAIFDVNFASLQSLGLLINYTYTIHLKVTDSEGQSDVADSTLIIVPKPATVVAVDIKPGSCPNPVNVKSSGVLPIAILGTDDYDVTTIDPTSVRLAGVEPLRSSFEDVATPVSDSNDCNCITDGPDGFLDLTLKFETQRIVEAVGDVNDGDELQLELIGVLFDETPIEGADCILIRGRHKPINPADINKDGVVDMADFAIFTQNWLQSSIVDK